MRYARVLTGMLLVAVLSGCATTMKTAMDKKTEKINVGEDAVFLLTAELSNDYKPSYQPDAMVLNVETPDANSSEQRFNYMVDEDGTVKKETGNKYVFRGRLKPGKYVIRGIAGTKASFPVMGTFYMPLHCEFEAKKGQVSDLGKVIAKIRERQGYEFRAGPVTPLIDQAVTGFSGGTFDIQVVASNDTDTRWMKSLFPALRTVDVVPATLPPFDRQKAQKWWEDH